MIAFELQQQNGFHQDKKNKSKAILQRGASCGISTRYQHHL